MQFYYFERDWIIDKIEESDIWMQEGKTETNNDMNEKDSTAARLERWKATITSALETNEKQKRTDNAQNWNNKKNEYFTDMLKFPIGCWKLPVA